MQGGRSPGRQTLSRQISGFGSYETSARLEAVDTASVATLEYVDSDDSDTYSYQKLTDIADCVLAQTTALERQHQQQQQQYQQQQVGNRPEKQVQTSGCLRSARGVFRALLPPPPSQW